MLHYESLQLAAQSLGAVSCEAAEVRARTLMYGHFHESKVLVKPRCELLKLRPHRPRHCPILGLLGHGA